MSRKLHSNKLWTMYYSLCFADGQALVSLLFYVMIILVVTSGAVMLIAINSLSATKLQEGVLAYGVAEGGAENAVLRVLRDPTYIGENDLPIGSGMADISVTLGNPVSIVSTGKVGNFMRKIQVIMERTSGFYTITTWQEIP